MPEQCLQHNRVRFPTQDGISVGGGLVPPYEPETELSGQREQWLHDIGGQTWARRGGHRAQA
jgi:hypothetical protein